MMQGVNKVYNSIAKYVTVAETDDQLINRAAYVNKIMPLLSQRHLSGVYFRDDNDLPTYQSTIYRRGTISKNLKLCSLLDAQMSRLHSIINEEMYTQLVYFNDDDDVWCHMSYVITQDNDCPIVVTYDVEVWWIEWILCLCRIIGVFRMMEFLGHSVALSMEDATLHVPLVMGRLNRNVRIWFNTRPGYAELWDLCISLPGVLVRTVARTCKSIYNGLRLYE